MNMTMRRSSHPILDFIKWPFFPTMCSTRYCIREGEPLFGSVMLSAMGDGGAYLYMYVHTPSAT